jgi:flavin reductase (DIM6/NTAB) family NADH-FMN oxidoreductase RutF
MSSWGWRSCSAPTRLTKPTRFSRCRWHLDPSGAPILDDCGRWFVSRILWRRELGDHVGFLLEPIAAHAEGSARSLLFSQVRHLDPGHDP